MMSFTTTSQVRTRTPWQGLCIEDNCPLRLALVGREPLPSGPDRSGGPTDAEQGCHHQVHAEQDDA
jgi:hypothetical protein